MTRLQLLALALAGSLVAGGAWLWSRWGSLVWLDSALAFCL